MASSTPSAPINSSRGAADTTAGRIYISTPSAQVRVPVGDLVFPPPHFCSHYTTRGKINRRRKNYPAAAIKTIRRRNNYPGLAQVGQKFEKKLTVPKTGAQCRKYLLHIFIHWAKLYPIFIHWTELNPISKHWNELYPVLIFCRTVPYLNRLSRTIPYLNTLSRTVPYLNTLPNSTLS